MIKSQCFINTAKNETYVFKRFKRKQNSDYEYESFPDITFRGKIANTPETKNYRLQKGINTSSNSVFIMSSNLPIDIQVGDKISFLNSIYTVESIGYYFEVSKLVNASILDNDYIVSKCPKGLTLIGSL